MPDGAVGVADGPPVASGLEPEVVLDLLCFFPLAVVAEVSGVSPVVADGATVSGGVALDGYDRDWGMEPEGMVPGVRVPGVGVVPGSVPGLVAPGLVPGDAAPGWPDVAPALPPAPPPAVWARAGMAKAVAKVTPKIKVLRMWVSSV